MLAWFTIGLAASECITVGSDGEAGVPNFPKSKPNIQPVKSDIIDKKMNEVATAIKDPQLKLLFTNTYQNTLETTTAFTDNADPAKLDTFVITGDIDAMWIRDSTNQVLPFLRYMKDDDKINRMIIGVINRQKANIAYDPYANAFNPYYMVPNPSPNQQSDTTTKLVCPKEKDCYSKLAMTNLLWERKFELDTLAAFLRLSWEYSEKMSIPTTYKALTAPFDEDWVITMRRILDTAKQQQLGTDEEKMQQNGCYAYTFRRNSSEALDSLIHGVGHPAPKKTGLIRAGFRPSDDAQTYPYHIPSNMMFNYYLEKICESVAFKAIFKLANKNAKPENKFSITDCNTMVTEVRAGLMKSAKIAPDGKFIYAYEADGNVNNYRMDDANHPSLLSLPLLSDNPVTDPTYQNTRDDVLSSNNAYYAESSKPINGITYKAIGGPHEWLDMIWPMGMITQGLTTNMASPSAEDELEEVLTMLVNSHAKTYCIHEAFYKDDPNNYTRPWFAWANGMFGDFIVWIYEQKPDVLKKSFCKGEVCKWELKVPVAGCKHKIGETTTTTSAPSSAPSSGFSRVSHNPLIASLVGVITAMIL